MNESCTLYYAIALLAYRDEDVAQRYGAKPTGPASGRERRQSDVLYPTNSNLPGTETFKSIRDENVLREAVRQWEEQDRARWLAARAELWKEVQSNEVPAFNVADKVGVEFWLTHDLDSPEAQYLRFRRSDLMRLLDRSENMSDLGTVPGQPEWHSVKNPRSQAWILRFRDRQWVHRQWVWALDLADWYSNQRGAVITPEREALHDDACQQLYRSLLRGDFVDWEGTPRVKPHLLNDGGLSPMLPEHAEKFRGMHWSGQRDRDSEPILSSSLLRELMHDVWLPAGLVAGWCRVRQIAVPEWLPRSLATAKRIVERSAQLPSWLSPMEAIAWIVSRSPEIVGYADPECNTRRVFFIEHTLPDGKRIGGDGSLPPGMTLGWLDAFAAFDPETTPPSDEALSELLYAARAGQITARAVWTGTGERQDMGTDEWRGLTLESPPRNERVLLAYRTIPGMLAKQPETRWTDVLFPTAKLLELWPSINTPRTDETDAQRDLPARPDQPSPIIAANLAPDPVAQTTQRKHRGGRPRVWDWDAFDREMMRLANTPDGLPERPRLQNHMLQWCELTWGNSPADSTVRERIARLYPEQT